MNPCYQDDRATLYQGEALAVLASLEDESIDAVIADPRSARLRNAAQESSHSPI